MADYGRVTGERVMCHSCQHEWQRSQGGLICPHCESDFTEILENNAPPRTATPPTLAAPGPLSALELPHPFHPHTLHGRPTHWPSAPDPEEDDIHTYQFDTTAGGGRSTISFTRTYTARGNGRNVMHAPSPDPDMDILALNFSNLLTNIATPQNSRHRFPNDPMMNSLFPFGGVPLAGARQPSGFGAFAARPINHHDTQNPNPGPPNGNINDLFSFVFNHLNQNHPNTQDPNQPANPFAILSQLFNPANARHGDAVFSQEAFDQVMSQLMDQNSGSTAPGPASEAAIEALPTKQVGKEMMGNDGTAECSICMDNVEIGDQVTVLPCKHWFHGQCISAWLKEHDTCPHCRKPITNPDGANTQAPGGSRRRSSRRASSIGSPRSPGLEGSRNNPVAIPESPSDIREAREQFFSHRRNEDYDRPRSHRHSSHGSERPSGSRQGSRSGGSGGSSGSGGSGGSSGSGNGGGSGVGGWFRNHLPFQG